LASKAVVEPFSNKDENGKKPFEAAAGAAAAAAEGAEGTAAVGTEPGAEVVFGHGAGVGSGTVCAAADATASTPPTIVTRTMLAPFAPLAAMSFSPRIVRTPVTGSTAKRALWRIRGCWVPA
jgi:hypothetical protein